MAKRISTGKRQRFEIFKRDSFRCGYCGRSPPEVLLHVDHIVPVAAGGTNDPINLVTACADCNSGKAARPLTAVSLPLKEQVERKREMAAQVKAHAEAMIEARRAEDATVEMLAQAWFQPWPVPGDASARWVMNREHAQSLKRFVGALPIPAIMEAIDITHWAVGAGRVPRPWVDNERMLCDNSAFRYFCGVCWRFIKNKPSGGTTT